MAGIIHKLLFLSIFFYCSSSFVCMNSRLISNSQQLLPSSEDSKRATVIDTVAVDTSAVCFVNGKRTSYRHAFDLYHQGKTIMIDYAYSQREAVERYGEIARNGFYAFISKENYLND